MLGANLIPEKLIDVFAVTNVVNLDNIFIFVDFINDTVTLRPERHIA